MKITQAISSLLAVLVLASCTHSFSIQKRKYQKGYHFEVFSHQKASKRIHKTLLRKSEVMTAKQHAEPSTLSPVSKQIQNSFALPSSTTKKKESLNLSVSQNETTEYSTGKPVPILKNQDGTEDLDNKIKVYRKRSRIFLLAGLAFIVPFFLPTGWTMGILFLFPYFALAAFVSFLLALLFFIMMRVVKKRRTKKLGPQVDLLTSELYAKKIKAAKRRFKIYLALSGIFLLLAFAVPPLIVLLLVTLILALVNRHSWRKYTLRKRKLDQTEEQKQQDEVDRLQSRLAMKHVGISLLLLLAGIAVFFLLSIPIFATGVAESAALFLLSLMSFLVFGIISARRARKAWPEAQKVRQRRKGEGLYPSRRKVVLAMILSVLIQITIASVGLVLLFLLGSTGW